MPTNFYETLSRYYDGLFPVDEKEMAFVGKQLAGLSSLLDIGCGTGNKTVFFSPVVDSITAFDRDEGMIAKARQDNSRPNIAYRCLDMDDMNAAFAGKSFDAAVCLGNTLVHLTDAGRIASLVKNVHGLLSPGGLFLLQILNYDRILDKHITSLPALESNEAVFTRGYRREGPLLHFLTSITGKAEGHRYDNDVPLYPLRLAELNGILADAGFQQPSLYGSYDGAPYSPDSFLCIASARKLAK